VSLKELIQISSAEVNRPPNNVAGQSKVPPPSQERLSILTRTCSRPLLVQPERGVAQITPEIDVWVKVWRETPCGSVSALQKRRLDPNWYPQVLELSLDVCLNY
jgi:hypothetical protein